MEIAGRKLNVTADKTPKGSSFRKSSLTNEKNQVNHLTDLSKQVSVLPQVIALSTSGRSHMLVLVESTHILAL